MNDMFVPIGQIFLFHSYFKQKISDVTPNMLFAETWNWCYNNIARAVVAINGLRQ